MSDTETEYDAELQLLQQGEEALAKFVQSHRDRLLQIVRFRIDPRLRRRIDEEDILQETFFASAKRLHHYLASPEVSPFIWLRSMLNQTMIDLYRKHIGVAKRDAGREVPIDGQFAQATSASLAIQLVGRESSPSNAAQRDEMTDRVRAMIDEMEPIDREVLVMRHYEELTNNEIAEVLELTTAAASIRYVRALERLRKIVDALPGFTDYRQPSRKN